MELRRKRAYEDPAESDGYRVLVDRLWPRGLSKQRAAIDLWAKDTAPSPQLRRDWHAAPDSQWHDYADRYRAELDAEPAATALADLAARLREHPIVTLVYAAHDERHNHAIVLAEVLTDALRAGTDRA